MPLSSSEKGGYISAWQYSASLAQVDETHLLRGIGAVGKHGQPMLVAMTRVA